VNPIDQAIIRHLPTVIMPTQEPLEELDCGKVRLIMAQDGVYIEHKTPWGHFRIQAMKSPRKLPYGKVTEKINITVPPMSLHMRLKMADHAVQALPKEWAGHVVLKDHELHYIKAEGESGIGVFSNLKHPDVHPNHIILDVHSHGQIKPYFSETDMQDMKGGTFIALVLGHCDRELDMSFDYGLNVQGVFKHKPKEVRDWLTSKGG